MPRESTWSACDRWRAAARCAAYRRLAGRHLFEAYLKSRGAQIPLDCLRQQGTNIDTMLFVQFTNSGRTCDVDLGDEVADDVQTDKYPARVAQLRSDLRAEPSIAIIERTALGARAGRQIAAVVVSQRNGGQRVGHRLAGDQNDAAVPCRDNFRQVALHDGVAGAVAGQGLEHHIAVLVALLENENGFAAHAIQRLAHGLAVLPQEFAHVMHVARDEGGRATLRKPGRIDLLVDVAQPLRPIVDMSALQLRPIEDVGAVNVFGVERRVLAHQDHVVFTQLVGGRFPQREPFRRIVRDLERRQPAPGNPVAKPQVFLFRVVQLPASGLRAEQEPQGGVLRRLDRSDRVHDHDETYSRRHAHSLSLASGGSGRSLGKTVNQATVVCPYMPRNVDPVPWLARAGYVKKQQDYSTSESHGEHDHQRQAETHGPQGSRDR